MSEIKIGMAVRDRKSGDRGMFMGWRGGPAGRYAAVRAEDGREFTILRANLIRKTAWRQSDKRSRPGPRRKAAATMVATPKTKTRANRKASDRLAYEVARVIVSGILNSRSPAADALLDYLKIGSGGPETLPAWMEQYEQYEARK